MNASAMIAERDPTEVSSFDFQVECTDRTVQYKLNAQSLRLFGLHRDVNDAHRAGANRLQNKQQPPFLKEPVTFSSGAFAPSKNHNCCTTSRWLERENTCDLCGNFFCEETWIWRIQLLF